MERNKKSVKLLLIIGLTVLISSCNLYDLLFPSEDDSVDRDNYCEFTVTGSSGSTDYIWNSTSDQGFLASSGYYFRIFAADDDYADSTFHDCLFINVADNFPGNYDSSDGVTNLTYYDTSGEMYMIFSSNESTYIDITISTWNTESVAGSFSGALMAYPSYDYVDIQGTFTSFDSTGRDFKGIEGVQNLKNLEEILNNDSKVPTGIF